MAIEKGKGVPHELPSLDGYCQECQEEIETSRKKCHFCSKYYQSFKLGDYPTMCQDCGEVMEERGMYRSCQLCGECWAKKLREEKRKKLNECQERIKELQQTEDPELTLKDYSELKKIESEIKKLNHQYESKPFKAELEELTQEISKLENIFPEKIKLKYRGKNKNNRCSHRNISWNEFFQKRKSEIPYCLDCGEDENTSFTKEFQKYYGKEIQKWLDEKKLKSYEFAKFLKEEGYYDNWCDLRSGNFLFNIKLELLTFQELSNNIEEYCLELAKSKGIKVDDVSGDNNNKKERKRSYAKILMI
jgi:hypothetical protein